MQPNKPRRSMDGVVSGSIHRKPEMPKPIDKPHMPTATPKPVTDVKPPVQSPQTPVKPTEPEAVDAPVVTAEATTKPTERKAPLLIQENEPMPKDKPIRRRLMLPAGKKTWKWVIVSIILVLFIAGGIALGAGAKWYFKNLEPVSQNTSTHIKVTINEGETPAAIADKLEKAGVIRSAKAFEIYVELHGDKQNLRWGTYFLQPSVSVGKIVDVLKEGKQVTFRVAFLPGGTEAAAKQSLLSVGVFKEAQIDAALAKHYTGPLFASKPQNTTLEGYFYGIPLEFNISDSLDTVLNKFFDEYYGFIKDNNIVAGFQKQGLTLYQGLTLASIVQKEMKPNSPDDAKKIAGVFLNRLKKGMTLGSDVTYQYAADKAGVPRDTQLDSPYNTRKFAGLPPGPIASPGNTAMLAVANPAVSDNLFFLSGDDDVTYFATTDADHQKNILLHCVKKCQIL